MKPKRKNQSKPRCKTCAVNLAALDDATKQFNTLAVAKNWLAFVCELNLAEYLKATSALKEELLATATLREEIAGLKRDYKAQIERTYAENEKDRQANVDAYNKLWNERSVVVAELEDALAHSDAERRKLERDVLAQRAELAKLQPFNRILGAFPARGPIA